MLRVFSDTHLGAGVQVRVESFDDALKAGAYEAQADVAPTWLARVEIALEIRTPPRTATLVLDRPSVDVGIRHSHGRIVVVVDDWVLTPDPINDKLMVGRTGGIVFDIHGLPTGWMAIHDTGVDRLNEDLTVHESYLLGLVEDWTVHSDHIEVHADGRVFQIPLRAET